MDYKKYFQIYKQYNENLILKLKILLQFVCLKDWVGKL